jgi:hypothetical protein
MPNSIQTLARSGYIANEATLTAIARRYVEGVGTTEEVRGTYLRVLVAHSKQELEAAGVKRVTITTAKNAVQRAHDTLYPVVLKAITTPDIAPMEEASPEETRRRTLARNSRSTFARTSKTTLMRAIEAGERLAGLDPATVTKEALQARYAQVRAGPGTPQDRIVRLRDTLEKQIQELAKEDAEAAQEAVDELVIHLQALVRPPEPMKGRRKVGELTLQAH